MRAQLATVVAVRRPSTRADAPTGRTWFDAAVARPLDVPPGDVPPGELELVVFPTPAPAVDAAVGLVSSEPDAAAGIHVAETVGWSDLEASVVQLMVELVRQAAPGEVLVTDVVAQLIGGGAPALSPSGHVRGPGGPIRVHARTTTGLPARPATFGRRAETASIDSLLDELLRGSGRALFLEGEAGIGKTHLAAAAADLATSCGVAVARATADELGRDRPGRLALDLLAAMHGRSPAHTGGHDPRPGGHRFVENFTAAVERAAERRPLLLVAEDLHWADDLSLRSLGALAPRLTPVSAGVLVTLRPAPRPPLLTTLTRVFASVGAEHHVLEPLDPEAMTSLAGRVAGALPGPRLRERLLATGGNPLFVIEMLSALEQAGRLEAARGIVEIGCDLGHLPDRLRATVLHRVRDLPAATVELLRHASLLGSTCELDVLSVVTGRSVSVVIEGLRPAVEASVLVLDRDVVGFRHDVIREAVAGELPPAVRREMHAAAGVALAAAGESPVQVARQLALGARPGDIEPVEWLERAAAEARALDPSATVGLLEEAIALAPAGWDGIARLRCALIEPLAASGRVDEAVERARLALADSPEPALRRRATSGLVAALATRGDLLSAVEVAARAAADPVASRHDRLVFDCVATSMRVLVDGSVDEVRRAAQAALAERPAADPTSAGDELGCWAMHSLGWVSLLEGRYADAFDAFDESHRLLTGLDVPDHGFLIPHVNAATSAGCLDDFDRFEARRRALVEVCIERGEVSLLVLGHFGGAFVARTLGRWDDALAEAEAGLALAAETGADSMTVGLHAVAALVHAARGQPVEAAHHLTSGFEVLERGAHLFGVDLLVLGRALQLEDAGHPEQAGELLAAFWDQAGQIVLALQYRDLVPHVVRLAGPSLDSSVTDVLATVDRAAHNTPSPSTIATAARCRGLRTHDADLLVAAVEQLRDSPRRVTLAETCEEAATVCFASGRADQAVALVDEAVAIWEAAGANRHIARLDALCRSHGFRRRRSGPAPTTRGWEALSPKEWEVVELVASGLSNPEIGEQLYISRRTVESHLSHVFNKLGFTNRTQLAAAVTERRGRSVPASAPPS